ncbi:MAG: lipopolysaccharide heptosyltransferase II [bacterium]
MMVEREAVRALRERGYVLRRQGELEILVHNTVSLSAERLQEEIKRLRECGGSRGERNIVFEPDGGEKIFLKQYHHGGLFASPGDTVYSSPERFVRELRATDRVYEEYGFVPRPLGCVWQRGRAGWRGYYLSEFIDIRPPGHLFRDRDCSKSFEEAGNMLARLHRLGIDHLDFHIGNLMVDNYDKIYAVDFDPVKFRQPFFILRGWRVHRFLRSLKKRGYSRKSVRAFLSGYRQVYPDFFSWLGLKLSAPVRFIKDLLSDSVYAFRGCPLDSGTVEKILIRAPNWIGDAVMSLPLLQDLKKRYPDSIIDVIARSPVTEIYKFSAAVDKVLKLPGKVYSYRAQVKDENYSAVLVLPKSLRTALQAWLSGIPRRFGLGCRGRSLLLSDSTPLAGKDRSQHHAFVFYRAAGRLIEASRKLPVPELNFKFNTAKMAAEFPVLEKSYITIHPGSAYGPAKRWPVELFNRFLSLFLEDSYFSVVAVGTGGEANLAEKIFEGLPEERVFNLAGETSLKQCMALLKNSRATVANDSGIMHLSAALGTPTLGIFGSTSPQLTAPLGKKTAVVSSKPECSPCFERDCPLAEERYKCLKEIEPQTVYRKFKQLTGWDSNG